MGAFIDYLLNKNHINPVGKSYTDGTVGNTDISPIVSASVANIEQRKLNDSLDTGYELNVLGDESKYESLGMTPNVQLLRSFNSGTLDKQLSEIQSASSKWWNGLKQAGWSETVLGTLKGFTDLYDVITGEVFKPNNDYQNPASAYLEQLQERYRQENPIYIDPDNAHDPRQAGWWASNMPSIMSSLTLLIPSAGVSRGLGALAKATKLDKFTRGSIKALTGANKFRAEEIGKLKGFSAWANRQGTIESANRMLDVGVTALASRTLENYQEARQVYNDMYAQASESFNKMSQEEWASYLNKHPELDNIENLDTNDRNAVAKYIASNSADVTFKEDYANLIFDVAQLYALKNPLKLMRNMRTTAAVNKVQRLSKRYANVPQEDIAKLEAARTRGQKIMDWTSDNLRQTAIITAELSEGVEEAVNYVAQQEGMHYGNLMLGKDADSGFYDRLLSYGRSPELYESAFWGWLGGIVFQVGGSGFNTLQRGIAKKIDRSRNKQDEKTKESINRESWQDDFENPETKRRVEDINARSNDLQILTSRLQSIKNDEDPFHVDPSNPNKKAALNSDPERDAAISRSIDEYITGLTLRAMDSGNYDLLKDYLRDPNVRQALIANKVIDEANADTFVEQLITKMDNVQQRYDDNLIALDNISAGLQGNIPLEYLQIIARDNVAAQLDVDDLTRRINNYEASAEANWNRYKKDLDIAIDYKGAASLVVAAGRLGMLRAELRELQNDKDAAKSLAGQVRINQINKEIGIINDYIVGNQQGDLSNETISKLLWTTGVSLRGTYNEAGKLVSTNTDEYIDFLDKLSRRDIKGLSELTGVDFKVSDDNILKIFGETTSDSGTYQVLSQVLEGAFDVEKGIDKVAEPLNRDYQTIAALEINRLIQQNKVAVSLPDVQTRVNELHNAMNEARTKAIDKAYEDIHNLVKKYSDTDFFDYIYNNGELSEDVTEADKNILDRALDVLNLTSPSNRQLYDNLQMVLALASVEAQSNEAVAGEETQTNVISENPSESRETSQTGESTPNISEAVSEPASTEIQASESPQPTQNIEINLSLDGNITATTISSDDATDKSFPYIENEDGSVTLLADQKDDINKSILAETSLFDGYEVNNTNKPIITKNPIIYKDGDETIVVEKGQITYEEAEAEQAAAESTISSTGERMQTEIVPVAAPTSSTSDDTTSQQSVVEQAEDDLLDSSRIINEAVSLFKNRDTSRNAEEVIAEIRETLRTNNPDVKQEHIDRAIRILTNRATRKGLISSVANVVEMSSSITEIHGRYDFTQSYKDAANKMLEDYVKFAKVNKINGKYYINLEDMLRDINELYEDKAMAKFIYNSIKEYLKQASVKELYTTTDENTDDTHFLDNVNKTKKDRILEKVGARNRNRVAIDYLFENPTKEFLNAFNSIEVEDELSVSVGEGGILLSKNGTVIGKLPMPKVDGNTGNFYMWNNGWKTDVFVKENGDIVSDLRNVFQSLLLNNTELNDLIKRLNYDTLEKEEKEALIGQVYDLLKQTDAKDYIHKNATKEEVVGYIQKLWKYFDVSSKSEEDYNDFVSYGLDLWFNKLFDSYSLINDVVKNNIPIVVTVDNITSGELVRKREIPGTDYNEFTPVTKALANPKEARLGVVNATKGDQLDMTDGTKIEHAALAKSGSVYVVIKNKSGINEFIIGTATKTTDKKVTKGARKIIKAVENELNSRINKHINDKSGNYDGLFDLLHKLFYTTNSAGNINGLKANTALFRGVIVNNPNNGQYGISISVASKTGDGASIQINPNGKTFRYKKQGDTTWRNGVLTKEEDKKIFKDTIMEIFHNASFNISYSYMNSDKNSNLQGLATINNKGYFEVRIPNQEDSSKDVVITAKSFRDFVINNDIIRINTEIDKETGTNFRRKGKNQQANQILEVRVETPISSPVEEIDETPSEPAASSVETILKDNSIKDKATEILKSEISEEALKTLNDLHLLPENIIFAESLNEKKEDGTWRGDNARARLSTGETLVGNRWIDMFNETGEFAGATPGEYRKQAIRKLIHEQLHHKLNKSSKDRKNYLDRISTIYDEFKAYLDNNNVAEDDVIRQYLFANEDREIALEEFLVESLTSKELAEYLNLIEAKDYDTNRKDTLWSKILKVLSDLFEWPVIQGSLYEKELSVLQDEISTISAAATNVTQLEFNFDEQQEASEPITTQQVEKLNLDDIDPFSSLNDILGTDIDSRGSSIVEDVVRHPSVIQFMNTIPTDEKVEFADMVSSGEISVMCR